MCIRDRDCIGDTHQWRMQSRCHIPHHVIADEDGQHEDGEEVDEFIYNDNDPIVQDAKKNMEEREKDDKNYPPEID